MCFRERRDTFEIKSHQNDGTGKTKSKPAMTQSQRREEEETILIPPDDCVPSLLWCLYSKSPLTHTEREFWVKDERRRKRRVYRTQINTEHKQSDCSCEFNIGSDWDQQEPEKSWNAMRWGKRTWMGQRRLKIWEPNSHRVQTSARPDNNPETLQLYPWSDKGSNRYFRAKNRNTSKVAKSGYTHGSVLLLRWWSTGWRGSTWFGRSCPGATWEKPVASWTVALCRALLLNSPRCSGSSLEALAGTPGHEETIIKKKHVSVAVV